MATQPTSTAESTAKGETPSEAKTVPTNTTTARNRYKRNQKRNFAPIDSKTFVGETTDMNGQLFQSVEESKDATQYVKTLEALERYAFKTYTVDMSSLFQRDDPEMPEVEIPRKPTEKELSKNPSKGDIYQLKLKEYIKEERTLKMALKSLWAVIWGQCSTSIRTKLEKRKDMKDLKKGGNVVELLKYIQQACMNYEDRHHPCVTLYQQFSAFHLFYQKESLPIQKYLQIFRIMVENIERYGGDFGNDNAIVTYVLEREGEVTEEEFTGLNDGVKETYLKMARDQYLAISFLLGGNRTKYGQLVADLQNSYILGEDKYPKDLEEAYDMMLGYSPLVVPSSLSEQSTKDLYTSGVSFYQVKERKGANNSTKQLVPGVSGKVHKNITCYVCDNVGHYANDCPSQHTSNNVTNPPQQIENGNKQGFSFMQCSFNMIRAKHQLNASWVLLDTQSSCDIFNNERLLEDIQEKKGKGLTLYSNGDGTIRTNMVGTVVGYGEVWYHPQSLANIMSFANVRRKFKVEISTGPHDKNPTIEVTKSDGTLMSFKEVGNGLYVYDATEDIMHKKNNTTLKKNYQYSLVSTVFENECHFTPRELKSAKLALELHRKIGRPSKQLFFHILRNNIIRDCPVTECDAKRAFSIYGEDVGSIKGKTKRIRPDPVKTPKLLETPDFVLKWHANVTLCIDIMYVNGMSFFHNISKKIQFRTIEYIPSENEKTLAACLQRIIPIYTSRGLTIEYVCGDQQFKCLEEKFRNIQFKIASVGEHVPEVERSIQTVKGGIRAVYHSMPYQILPPIMIKEMVESQVSLRNKFPSPNGIHEYMSPLTIMTGVPNPSYLSFKIEFGQYVQAHDHPNVTNSMKTRTTPAIALGASKSENGWYFMSLETGKKILRYRWTTLPISQSVIDRVHKMADLLKIKNKSTNLPLFSEEPNYESECSSVNNKNNMKNQKSNGEGVRSFQTDDQSDTGEESFEAQAKSPNYRSNNTSYHTILEEPDTGSRDSQQDRAGVEDELMEDSRISNVEDMASIASFGDFDASNFASQSIDGEFQIEGWDNKSVLNDVPYLDCREVDEDSAEYELNTNNDPEHDTDHVYLMKQIR